MDPLRARPTSSYAYFLFYRLGARERTLRGNLLLSAAAAAVAAAAHSLSGMFFSRDDSFNWCPTLQKHSELVMIRLEVSPSAACLQTASPSIAESPTSVMHCWVSRKVIRQKGSEQYDRSMKRYLNWSENM